MNHLTEEGRKNGLKLGQKYEKKLFPYYKYYAIHGCRKAITVRLKKISDIFEKDYEINELIDENKLSRDRSKKLIQENNFQSYDKRRTQEINIIYQDLMIEILKEIKKKKNDAGYWEGIKCGILISFGIMKK